MKTIKTLEQTCPACPSQWEGYTTDNTPFYIRYELGWLIVSLGKQGEGIESAVTGQELLCVQITEDADGIMSTEEMLVSIQDVLNYV